MNGDDDIFTKPFWTKQLTLQSPLPSDDSRGERLSTAAVPFFIQWHSFLSREQEEAFLLIA